MDFNIKHKNKKFIKHQSNQMSGNNKALAIQRNLKLYEKNSRLNLITLKRIQFIVREYFQLLPKYQIAENRINVLIQYNKKLYEILVCFEGQEASLISRLSKLEDLYIQLYFEYSWLKGKQFVIPKKNLPERIFGNFNLKELDYQSIGIPEIDITQTTRSYKQQVIKIVQNNFLTPLKTESAIIKKQLKILKQYKDKYQAPEEEDQQLQLTQQQIQKLILQGEKGDLVNLGEKRQQFLQLISILKDIEVYNKSYESMQQVCEEQFFEMFELKSIIYKKLQSHNQSKGMTRSKMNMNNFEEQQKLVNQLFDLHQRTDKIEKNTVMQCLKKQKQNREQKNYEIYQANKQITHHYQDLNQQLKYLKIQLSKEKDRCSKLQKQLFQIKMNQELKSKKKNKLNSMLFDRSLMKESFDYPQELPKNENILADSKKEQPSKQLQYQINKNKNLQKYLQDKKSEMNKLENQIIKLNQKNKKLQARIQQLQAEKPEFQNYQHQKQKIISNLQQKYQQRNKDNNKLKETISELEDKIAQLQIKLYQIDTSPKQLKCQIKIDKSSQQLKEKLKKKIIETNQLNRKIITLEKALNDFQIDYKELESKYKSIKTENEIRLEKFNTIIQENGNYMQKYNHTHRQLAQKHEQLTQKHKQYQLQRQAANELRKNIINYIKNASEEGINNNLNSIKDQQLIDILMKLLEQKKSESKQNSIIIAENNEIENNEAAQQEQNIESFSMRKTKVLPQIKKKCSAQKSLSIQIQNKEKSKSMSKVLTDDDQQYWILYRQLQQAKDCLTRQQQKNVSYELKYQKFVDNLLGNREDLNEDKKLKLEQKLFYLTRLAKQQKQTIDQERVQYRQIFTNYHNEFKDNFEQEMKNLRGSQSLASKKDKSIIHNGSI